MWELDYKESWVLKNWCFWTVVLEKTLESPLDCKEIQAVHPKGNQSWILIGRTDAEAPIFWPPDAKNQLIGKAPDTGTDWRPSDKGRQRMRWLDSITDWMDMNLSKLQEIVEDRGVWPAAVTVGHNLGIEQQQQQRNQTRPSLWRQWSNAVIIIRSTFFFFWSCILVVCF